MNAKADLLVIISVMTGVVIGLTFGLVVDNARTFGGVGAMVGLVAGCLLTVLPPRARRTPVSPGRWRIR